MIGNNVYIPHYEPEFSREVILLANAALLNGEPRLTAQPLDYQQAAADERVKRLLREGAL
jgi:hypothetical protein